MKAKVKYSVGAAFIFLVLFLVVWFSLVQIDTWVLLLVGSSDLALIFVILMWVFVQRALEGEAVICRTKLKIIAFTLGIIVLVLVILLTFTLGFLVPFILLAAVDFTTIIFICLCTYVRRVRRRVEETHGVENSFIRRVAGLPTEFSYEVLKVATGDFTNLIGSGGSGSVFKGVLDNQSSVAVKRIEGEVGGEKQFETEIAAIASLQHTNLVRLLGYCLVGGRYLVYELIHNGSLDAWIFPACKGAAGRDDQKCLTWGLRYQVAFDVAKGLAYLHHDCHLRILHLDVKPANILLDASFHARVSDFGTSRLMGKDESSAITTVRGTRGYLAPEWFLESGISEKSDVYSYGLVLLELVGGQKNIRVAVHDDDGNINSQRRWFFPKIVDEKMREGKLMEIVDERLVIRDIVEEEELRVLVHVALWCIQEKPELRPSMKLVVDMLEGAVAVNMPPETRMFMADLLNNQSEPGGGFVRAQGATSVENNNLEGMPHPLMSSSSINMSTLSCR